MVTAIFGTFPLDRGVPLRFGSDVTTTVIWDQRWVDFWLRSGAGGQMVGVDFVFFFFLVSVVSANSGMEVHLRRDYRGR